MFNFYLEQMKTQVETFEKMNKINYHMFQILILWKELYGGK